MPAPLSFAGLALDCPILMGVVNVTPDSFSDGGEFFDADKAIARFARRGAPEIKGLRGGGAVVVDEVFALTEGGR